MHPGQSQGMSGQTQTLHCVCPIIPHIIFWRWPLSTWIQSIIDAFRRLLLLLSLALIYFLVCFHSTERTFISLCRWFFKEIWLFDPILFWINIFNLREVALPRRKSFFQVIGCTRRSCQVWRKTSFMLSTICNCFCLPIMKILLRVPVFDVRVLSSRGRQIVFGGTVTSTGMMVIADVVVTTTIALPHFLSFK